MLSEHEQDRTYLLLFKSGDEVIRELTRFARETGITAAHFTAIGAFSEATLAYYDWETKSYQDIPVRAQVEALMVAGDIALQEDSPMIHAHAVVSNPDGSTRGGHLRHAIVRPALELVLRESPRYLQRNFDPESGLALIDLNVIAGHRPFRKLRRKAG
ncbi:MAG: DNA-binding protein [Oligoflexia bacterium]|nr:DNA-binding protein [Oligoflexia bacterium]